VTAVEVYRERLWPGPWFWIFLLGMLGTLAIAYGYAVSAAAGWVVAVVGITGLLVAGWRLAVVIRVDSGGVAAGRARLPWWAVGAVLALAPAQVATARGPQGDRSAWVVSPPAARARGAVLITVADADDPHRTWLVASRRPEALARAIETTRERLRG
jgi:hypothetical protein